jgi:hypothetical protein
MNVTSNVDAVPLGWIKFWRQRTEQMTTLTTATSIAYYLRHQDSSSRPYKQSTHHWGRD